VEVVRAFLDRNAPIRAKFTAGPSHDDSPLCLAARNGHADVVTLLLSRGASVREKDEFDIGYRCDMLPIMVTLMLLNDYS
jgi:ankyrin repeat protein